MKCFFPGAQMMVKFKMVRGMGHEIAGATMREIRWHYWEVRQDLFRRKKSL